MQELDPATSTVLAEIPLVFPPGFPGTDPRPNAMDVNPDSGVLYTLLKGNFMSDTTHLGIIDPGTGQVTVVGQTADGLNSLAWGPPDADLDGFPDDLDACPDSDTRLMVIVGECNSGVPNALLDDGCTVSDLVDECREEESHDGRYLICVSRVTRELRHSGVITGVERLKILFCAAKSK